MNPTKTDEALAAIAEAHADDPERVEVLNRTRRFKMSWIELAEALTEIRRANSWQRWGFKSFEQYYKNELHLRQDTVDKLTGSYLFLKNKAPQVLERDAVDAVMPNYQAIDFLRRAEEVPDAPVEVVDSVRHKVLEEGVKASAIPREMREAIFPTAPEVQQKRETSQIRGMASRLRTLLGAARAIPPELYSELDAMLEKLIEALQPEDAAMDEATTPEGTKSGAVAA